jgi:hypothetical protein
MATTTTTTTTTTTSARPYTMLMRAVAAGDMARVRAVVCECGGRIPAGGLPTEPSALFSASHHGHATIATFLLSCGADPNARNGTSDSGGNGLCGCTALMAAAAAGHAGVVEALLAGGAAVDSADNTGTTALHAAATKGHAGVVEQLLACGADTAKQDCLGRTALFVASECGHTNVVVALLATCGGSGRVDLEQPDECGHTPLFVAAMNGHKDVVVALLAAGADPHHHHHHHRRHNAQCNTSMLPRTARHGGITVPPHKRAATSTAIGHTRLGQLTTIAQDVIHQRHCDDDDERGGRRRPGPRGGEGPGSERECTVCRKRGPGMLKCARCREAVYCSGECQRADWPQHRGPCSQWAAARERDTLQYIGGYLCSRQGRIQLRKVCGGDEAAVRFQLVASLTAPPNKPSLMWRVRHVLGFGEVSPGGRRLVFRDGDAARLLRTLDLPTCFQRAPQARIALEWYEHSQQPRHVGETPAEAMRRGEVAKQAIAMLSGSWLEKP